MRERSSSPPKVALWLLRGNPALAGDLIERYYEGKTTGWFWKQVLTAIAIGLAPQFCFGIVGALLFEFLWRVVSSATPALRWNALPWPWSQLAFEWRLQPVTVLLSLVALLVLATGLKLNGSFRWACLVRTEAIALAWIAATRFLPDNLPWLYLDASALFAAGWLGYAWSRKNRRSRA